MSNFLPQNLTRLIKRKYSISEIIFKVSRLLQHSFQLYQLKQNTAAKRSFLFYNTKNFNDVHNKILDMKSLPIKENIIAIKSQSGYKKNINRIINEADHYCNNKFNILGSGWKKWEKNSKIAWHTNKINNYTWDKDLYFTKVKKTIKNQINSNTPINEDCKIPRELSRFYFLYCLTCAYLLSDEEKYRAKIESSILEWIDDNPPFFGVNWSNAMEAAIRLFNWCICIYSLKDLFQHSTVFVNRFYLALYHHFLFITKNLETMGNKNNHFISNVTGIFTMCILFPVFRNSQKWLKWSVKQLEQEINRQTFNDGMSFECSTTYHRLSLELFSFPLLLSDFFSANLFSKSYTLKLKKMFEFSLNIIKPNGEINQIGDNDSGRLFKLEDLDSLDNAYLLSLAFGLFKDKQFCVREFNYAVDAFILFGTELYRVYNLESKHISLENLSTRGFTDSGIYILRNVNFLIAISCLSNSPQVRGVHLHNDKLSLDITYKNYNIIVDPGTVTYLGDTSIRNKYRSTSFHNTVQEGSLEQNSFGTDIFTMNNEAQVTVNDFNNSFINCQHNGFLQKKGHLHRREITLEKSKILIIDEINSADICQSYLHFDPAIQVDVNNNQVTIKNKNSTLLGINFKNAQSVSLDSYNYSPGYGITVPAQKLIVVFANFLNTIIFEYEAN